MIWELLQHFFSCSLRANFETVGVSHGFPTPFVRELEERARYPAKGDWKDSEEGPPRVLRGFQLSGGQWAVSSLTYVGASLTRHEGNYLAHSVLIPPDLRDYVMGNVAFLAVLLPQHSDYLPQSAMGADKVDSLTIASLDPNRQFRFFEFCVREMGSEACSRLLRALAADLSEPGKSSFSWDLPPPSENLSHLYQEILGAPEGTVPSSDLLRLLRLAGLTAILPEAFKHRLSFSVNDSTTSYQDYVVRVPRLWLTAGQQHPHQWDWFEYCAELAGTGGDVQLRELVAWLSRLIPAGCQPSLAALDAGFAYWRERRHPEDGPSALTLALFDRFRGYEVNFDFLIEELSGSQPRSGTDASIADDALVRLCALASAARSSLSPKLYRQVLERITPPPGDNFMVTAARREFFLKLPVDTRIEIWNRSWKAGEFPGRIRNSEHDLDFLASTFQPDLKLDPVAREAILQGLVAATIKRGEAGSAPGWSWDVSRPVHLAFNAMMSFDRPAGRLMCEIGVGLANQYRALRAAKQNPSQWVLSRGESPLEETSRWTREFLPRAGEAFVLGFVEFALVLCGNNGEDILQFVQRLPFERQSLAGTRLCLRRLADRLESPSFSRLLTFNVQALLELANLLENPSLHGPDEGLDHAFRAYVRLLKAAESHRIWGDVVGRFLEQVDEAIRSLRPIDRLPVVLGYLWFTDRSSQYLLSLASSVISSADKTTAHWIAAGRVGYLVKFIQVADARDSWYASSAWEPVDRLLPALEPRQRLEVLKELERRLDRTDVRGEIRKRVRQPQRELQHRLL